MAILKIIHLPPQGTLESDKATVERIKEETRKKRVSRYYRYRELNILNSRAYTQKIRKIMLDAFHNKCNRCGFSDNRALQVDHINGGGNIDKKNISRNYYKVVLESVLSGENKYQLLCANCNWIKRHENNEVRRFEVGED